MDRDKAREITADLGLVGQPGALSPIWVASPGWQPGVKAPVCQYAKLDVYTEVTRPVFYYRGAPTLEINNTRLWGRLLGSIFLVPG